MPDFQNQAPTLGDALLPASDALAPSDVAPSSDRARPQRLLPLRNTSLIVLATLGSIFMLHWAKPVLIPLLLGLLLSYALAPLVNRLERLHLPRAIAAGLVMLGMLGGLGATGWVLSDDAVGFIESMPAAAQKIRQSARATRHQLETTIDKVQKAATELEPAAKESSATRVATVSGVTRVQIERPQVNISDYLLTSTPDMLAAVGQAPMVLFISFWVLASGSNFRRKLVKLLGSTFARRKITAQTLDEITGQVQRYLPVQLLISAVGGGATGLAYAAIGLEHAAAWGVLAMVLNLVPYVGAIAVTGASALAGFVQFGNLDMALLVGGASLLLHAISGNLLTPWLTGRTSRINPLVIFVGVLVFGWCLAGVWLVFGWCLAGCGACGACGACCWERRCCR
jgi:predicted PurR-regulated permease PerM